MKATALNHLYPSAPYVAPRAAYRHGQTLIEFALAVPVLVAVFTIVFTLGYATYRAHSASTAMRALDQNLEAMANVEDPTPILQGALVDFSEMDGFGPTEGFGMIRGKYLMQLKWIPDLPEMNVVAFTILPAAVLASNSSFSGEPSQYTAATVGTIPNQDSAASWASFKDPMLPDTCTNTDAPANDPLHCIHGNLMDAVLPKKLLMADNCDTDLGPFIATKGTTPNHDNIPQDCFANGVDTDACHQNKLQHAAAYVTKFVTPMDADGACAYAGFTLLLPEQDYPPFIPAGAY